MDKMKVLLLCETVNHYYTQTPFFDSMFVLERPLSESMYAAKLESARLLGKRILDAMSF